MKHKSNLIPANKRLLYMMLLLVFASASPSIAEKHQEQPAAQASEIRVYQVFGMDCPGCHGGLEKLIMKIPEVQEAKANYKEQRLAVTLIPGKSLDDATVHDAIRRANFTLGKRIK